jgi:serine/threonine-protein kinase
VLDRYLAQSGARVTREEVAALVEGPAVAPRGATATGTVMTAVHAIAIGSKIGDYEVTQRLGEGGMGIVFAAVDQRIGKQVAIKLMRPQFAGDDKAVARFLEEARAVNKIRHSSIVDIFGFGTLDDGSVYCVMELLAGKNLREVLHDRGPLPPREAIELLRPVAAAIDAAHRAGVVHCDLKPDNIFVCDPPGRQIKVLDFGLSQLQGDLGAAESLVQIGTPMYMAPEQCRSERGDHRIDIYAFGIVAYNVLTKKLPFDSAGALAVIADHIATPPAPPSTHGLAARFDAPILRCLEKDPARRPATATEALAAIEAAARPRGKTRVAVAAGILGAAGIAAAIAVAVASDAAGAVVSDGTSAIVAASDAAVASDGAGVVATDAAVVSDGPIAVAPDATTGTPDAAIAIARDAGIANDDETPRPTPPVVTRPRPRPLPRPATPGLRIILGQATAFDDHAAIQRALNGKHAAFAACLGPDAPRTITVAFKVTALTGKPTGATYSIVPPDARRFGDCLAQVAATLSFGQAQREINAPPTQVIVQFVSAGR